MEREGQKEKTQLHTYLNTHCRTTYTTRFLSKCRNGITRPPRHTPTPALTKGGTIDTVHGKKEGLGAAFPPAGDRGYAPESGRTGMPAPPLASVRDWAGHLPVRPQFLLQE